MKQFVFVILILLGSCAKAQKVLTPEEFFTIVRSYHPIAKRAQLDVAIAKADVLRAKGNFDPVLQSEQSRKEFDGIMYYDNRLHEIKIPTWYGVDIQAGIQSLAGERTATTGTKGNSNYIGFSVPVVKNLLIDKRRAVLQQAKIFQDLSVQEQKDILNTLLYDAAKAYWNWWQLHRLTAVYKEAAQNAGRRFAMVQIAYRLGERPAIDTVEALTQLQSFQLKQTEIELEVMNAELELSLYLWQKDETPFAVNSTIVPHAIVVNNDTLPLENLLVQIRLHPQLQQYQYKLNALAIDRKLKWQALLPSVYLKYNQLSKSHNFTKGLGQPLLQNNYRYGISLSIPLRLSEGRGEYQQAKLKIAQAELERLNKEALLQTKIKQCFNEWQQLKQQISLQQRSVAGYVQLQRGEEIKFTNGESSLFFLNSREQKTLEAKQKLIELQGKEQKAKASVLWAAGVLNNY